MNRPAGLLIGRRQFVAGTVAVTGALAAAGSGLATASGSTRPLVLLLDSRVRLPFQIIDSWRPEAVEVLHLAGDPVRLWRSDAGRSLRNPAMRLAGLTSWPDLLVFRGLASESRRHLLHEQQDSATGTFHWLIA